VTELVDGVEIEPASPARASVIWLHGLGADGHDFVPIVPDLGLPASLAVRFVFPHAPVQPVTIDNGALMRAWYDVRDDGGVRREDPAGVRASRERIEALIARERRRGGPAAGVVLAGFSQGGAMALHTGVRHGERLAGIVALSCFLPIPDTLAAEATDANRDVPIFMAHGVRDGVIPVSRARRSRDALVEAGYRVAWHEYPMAHAVCPAEARDIGRWLADVLGMVRSGS
jgi:phospholipase/carboxylesterase